MYRPVHIPDALSSNPLSQVFPDPGELISGTVGLFAPLIKLQQAFLHPLEMNFIMMHKYRENVTPHST